jgi:hypothetical protein
MMNRKLMRTRIFRLLLVALASLSSAVPLSAAIIVEVQDAFLVADGVGHVDVMISSDGTEDLFSAGYEFTISGDATDGDLFFRSTQLSTEIDVPGPNGYVFGNVPTGNFNATPDFTFLTMGGGDFLNALPAVSLTGTQRLLARLEIEHSSTGSPLDAVGNTFKIGLIDNGFTEFHSDDTGTLSSIDPDSFAPGNFGTVTITSAAVPEPGTFGVLAVAAASVLGRRLRRRKVDRAASGCARVS